jgi:hypothetical protein
LNQAYATDYLQHFTHKNGFQPYFWMGILNKNTIYMHINIEAPVQVKISNLSYECMDLAVML